MHERVTYKSTESVKFRRMLNVLNCSMWVFSTPYACIESTPLISSAVAFRCRTANGGLCRHWLEPAVTVALYGFTRRRLRKIRHRVGCGIPSSRLALSVVFRGLRWKASLPQTLHSPLKGPVVLGILRCTGTTRHSGIFYTTSWRCSSPACSCRTWFENVAAQVQLDCVRAYSRTQKASSVPVSAIFTQPAHLAASDETKRPWHA